MRGIGQGRWGRIGSIIAFLSTSIGRWRRTSIVSASPISIFFKGNWASYWELWRYWKWRIIVSGRRETLSPIIVVICGVRRSVASVTVVAMFITTKRWRTPPSSSFIWRI